MSRRSKQVRKAAKRGARKARSEYGERMMTRYYRRAAKHEFRCAARGCKVRQGEPMAYRPAGSVKLCLRCAEEDPFVAQQLYDSASWALSPAGKARVAA